MYNSGSAVQWLIHQGMLASGEEPMNYCTDTELYTCNLWRKLDYSVALHHHYVLCSIHIVHSLACMILPFHCTALSLYCPFIVLHVLFLLFFFFGVEQQLEYHITDLYHGAEHDTVSVSMTTISIEDHFRDH